MSSREENTGGLDYGSGAGGELAEREGDERAARIRATSTSHARAAQGPLVVTQHAPPPPLFRFPRVRVSGPSPS